MKLFEWLKTASLMKLFEWVKTAFAAGFDSSLYAKRVLEADVQIDIDKQYSIQHFHRRDLKLRMTESDSYGLLKVSIWGLLWFSFMKLTGFSTEYVDNLLWSLLITSIAYPAFFDEELFTASYYSRLYYIAVIPLFLIENRFLQLYPDSGFLVILLGSSLVHFIVMVTFLEFYTYYTLEKLLCMVEKDSQNVKEFITVIKSIDNWYYYIKTKDKFTRVPYYSIRKVVVKHLEECDGVFRCMKDFISRTTVVESNLPDVFENTSDMIKNIFDDVDVVDYNEMRIKKYFVYITMLRSDVFTELYFNLLYNESIFTQMDQINRFFYLYKMITRPSFSEKAYKEILLCLSESRTKSKLVQKETNDPDGKTKLLDLLFIALDLIEQSSTISEVRTQINEIIERIYNMMNGKKLRNKKKPEMMKPELSDEEDMTEEISIDEHHDQKLMDEMKGFLAQKQTIAEHFSRLYGDHGEDSDGSASSKDSVPIKSSKINGGAGDSNPLARIDLLASLQESLKNRTKAADEVIYDLDD
uniref:Uncharacterized protein n=1 Tax=Panagrolaimus sp. JU765 TaxID=591449 RepID=A0AC34PWN9_9BILA